MEKKVETLDEIETLKARGLELDQSVKESSVHNITDFIPRVFMK